MSSTPPPGPDLRAAARVDGATMARLRQQAAGLPGVGGLAMLDDDTVIALLAGFARPGAGAAAELPLRALATPGESATPAPAPAAARRAGAAAAAPGPSDDTFGEPLDAAAMAASLREAAASGVPFCEECARARAMA